MGGRGGGGGVEEDAKALSCCENRIYCVSYGYAMLVMLRDRGKGGGVQ